MTNGKLKENNGNKLCETREVPCFFQTHLKHLNESFYDLNFPPNLQFSVSLSLLRKYYSTQRFSADSTQTKLSEMQ